MSENEKKNISFQADTQYVNALDSYCDLVNMTRSSFIKKTIGDILIEKGYLRKGGKQQ